MYRLVETLKIKDNVIYDLEWHNKRFNDSRLRCFAQKTALDLNNIVSPLLGNYHGLYKCRIIYTKKIEKIEFTSYQPKHPVSIRLIENNTIDYRYKYEDRSSLNSMLAQKGTADEIVIVKNGLLTDTSYSNICLFDGNHWHTPRVPLLKGTKREKLLSARLIIEKDITPDDLKSYSMLSMINTMLDLGKITVSTENIVW